MHKTQQNRTTANRTRPNTKVALLFTSMLNQEPSTLWCVSLQQNPRPFFSTSKDMHVIVAAQTDSKQSDQTAAKRARCTRN